MVIEMRGDIAPGMHHVKIAISCQLINEIILFYMRGRARKMGKSAP